MQPFRFFERYKNLDIACILLIALALRAWLFIGLAFVDPTDDMEYLLQSRMTYEEHVRDVQALAKDVAAEEMIWPPRAYYLRVAAVLPMRLFARLFGATETVTAIPSLLASLGTLVLVFWMANSLFDRSVARGASLLFATLPIDLELSTRILSASQHLFWFSATIALSIAATRHSERPRLAHLLAGTSGVSWVVAYLCRKTAVLALPIVALQFFLASRSWKLRVRFLSFAAVCAMGLLAEATYYGYLVGTPLLAFTAERQAHMFLFSAGDAIYPLTDWLRVHVLYLFGVPHHFFKLALGIIPHYNDVHLFGWFGPLAGISVAAIAWKRKGLIASFWLVFVFLFVQYGFVGLQWNRVDSVLDYYLVPQQLRYLHILAPPLAILISALIASISRTRPILRAGLVLVLCLYGAYQGHRNHLFYRGSLDDMRRAAELVELETFETRPVYADLWGARLLNLLIPDGTRVQVLNRIESVPDGAVVILGGARGYDLTPEEAMSGASDEIVAIHLGLAQPPSHWTEILRHRGERLIQRSSDLVAFQVSEAQPENAPAGPEKELDADEDFH